MAIGLTFLGWTSWHLGDHERATQLTRASTAFVADLGHDLSTGHVLLFQAWMPVLGGDAPSALVAGKAALDFAREKRLPFYVGMSGALHGWAVAKEEDPEAGIAAIHEALAIMDAGGAGLVRTMHLGLLAEAQWAAGKPEEALASLERAVALVETMDEHFWEPELHRLRGELLLVVAPERAADAEQELRTALAVARAQASKPLEQRAEESLVRFGGGRPAIS